MFVVAAEVAGRHVAQILIVVTVTVAAAPARRRVRSQYLLRVLVARMGFQLITVPIRAITDVQVVMRRQKTFAAVQARL
jgi:hypothetical protein